MNLLSDDLSSASIMGFTLSSVSSSLTSFCSEAAGNVTWNSCIIYLLIFGATWLFYIATIEPFFSPLRKIPGAPFNPILGNMPRLQQGQAMDSTIGFLKEYGSVYRYYFMFGRERVGVGDPAVMKHILVTNAKNYIKPPSRLFMMRMILGNGLVMSEGLTHAIHKRLMSPSFNNTSIKKMLPAFVERGEELTAFWKTNLCQKKQSGVVDIHADLTRTTLNIIGDTAFGYDFDCLQQPDIEIAQAFNRVISGSGLNWRFLIPYYYKLPFPEVKKLQRDIAIMRKTVNDIIQWKRDLASREGEDATSVTSDVLGMMMHAKDEKSGQGMSDVELQDQVITLLFAGHETTAVSMSWCLLMLADNSSFQERARQEILSVFSLDDGIEDISWEKLEQLKFCDNFVKETLRMYPPVPITLRQALRDDTYLNKYRIPKGTIVLLGLGPMMRLPEIFEDPETFNPDRFDDPQADTNFFKFVPFLIGARMCLGHKFAVMEMKALLVVLLRQLVFEKIEGTSYKRKLRTTMRPDPSLQLSVSLVKTG